MGMALGSLELGRLESGLGLAWRILLGESGLAVWCFWSLSPFLNRIGWGLAGFSECLESLAGGLVAALSQDEADD